MPCNVSNDDLQKTSGLNDIYNEIFIQFDRDLRYVSDEVRSTLRHLINN